MGKETKKIIPNAMIKTVIAAKKRSVAPKSTKSLKKKRKTVAPKKAMIKAKSKAPILQSFSPERKKEPLKFNVKKILQDIDKESKARQQRIKKQKHTAAQSRISSAEKSDGERLRKSPLKTADNKNKANENSSFLPVSNFRISSRFGVDRGDHRHSGIDLALPEGSAVASVKEGKVAYAGWSNGYGYRVIIDHGDGTKTTYSHLSDIGVEVGDEVKAGGQIALSGNTGYSTGPHLHFEVSVDGQYVDPESYYDFGNGITAASSGEYSSKLSSSRKSNAVSSSKSGKTGKSASLGKRGKSLVLPSKKAQPLPNQFNAKALLGQMVAEKSFTRRNNTAENHLPPTNNPLLDLVSGYRRAKPQRTARTKATKRS